MSGSFTQTISGQTLDIDLSQVGRKKRKRESLSALCTDIFLIVIRMRESEDLGKPAALRKLIMHYIELFRKNCRTIGTTDGQINAAVYALVALLDETVMSVPGECRDYWLTKPIQLELFGDNLAGEGYFRKLEKLLEQPASTKEVLEIYYLCLTIGFEGKFKLGNPEKRDQIIDNLARVLLKAGGRSSTSLSPHGRRNISSSMLKGSNRRLIPIWAVGIVALLLVVLWWGFMFFLTDQSLEQVLSIL